MKIIAIYTKNVGPLSDETVCFNNDWTENVEDNVLFTGPNGCGKSTLLRAIAMFWDATAYWLDHRKPLPQKHEAKQWLQQWDGVAVVMDGIPPFYEKSVGLVFGSMDWVDKLQKQHSEITWIGESIARTGKPGQPKRTLLIPKEEWLNAWANDRKKMILSYDKVEGSNVVYLDAEERRWVKPKRNLSEPQPDLLSQRWLTRYSVSEDWKGQLEASLITLKTTQLHYFHEVLRHLNDFLIGKEIDSDIKPGEGRLHVKLKHKRGVSHSLDDLSAGEHQVLIMIYLISRWMQQGGIVMIDEPDLYLHPSLVAPLLSSLEKLVAEKQGQLLITSHAVDVWQRYENQGKRIELSLAGAHPS